MREKEASLELQGLAKQLMAVEVVDGILGALWGVQVGHGCAGLVQQDLHLGGNTQCSTLPRHVITPTAHLQYVAIGAEQVEDVIAGDSAVSEPVEHDHRATACYGWSSHDTVGPRLLGRGRSYRPST